MGAQRVAITEALKELGEGPGRVHVYGPIDGTPQPNERACDAPDNAELVVFHPTAISTVGDFACPGCGKFSGVHHGSA